jgi:hypothetical protein
MEILESLRSNTRVNKLSEFPRINEGANNKQIEKKIRAELQKTRLTF